MTSKSETTSGSDDLADSVPAGVPRLSTTVIPFLRSHSMWVMGLSLAYWALLFVLTHLPNDKLPGPVWMGDKIAHAAAYAGLTWLLALNCHLRRRMSLAAAVAIVVVAACYGALDEFTQQFARGRTADIYDWLADVVGAVLGIAVLEGMNAMRPWVRRTLAYWINRSAHLSQSRKAERWGSS